MFNLLNKFAKILARLGHLAGALLLTALLSLPVCAAPLKSVFIESNFSAGAEPQLAMRLQAFTGKEITVELLNEVLAEVSRYYQEQGYPQVRAYFPADTGLNGNYTVYVHDPQIKAVEVENRSYMLPWAANMLLEPLYAHQGENVAASRIEERLLTLSDLGIFDVEAVYAPSSDTDLDPTLRVSIEDKSLFAFDVFTDNHGTKSAGEYRFGGQLKLRNVIGTADTLSFFYARSSGEQNNYALNYETVINSYPTMLGLTLCLTDYELGREYEDLGAQGESQDYEIYLRHPFIRSSTEKLDFTLGFRYRDLSDEFAEFDVRFKKETYALYANLSGAVRPYDDLVLAGYLRATALKLNNQEDDFNFYEDGTFGLLNFGGLADCKLTDTLSLKGDIELQMATGDVDSSEHFVASGASGVKAYDSNVAQGDQGLFLSAGLEYAPFDDFDFTITPHLDYGCVQDLSTDESESIAGAGLALSAEFEGLYLKLDFAHALGSAPASGIDEGQILFTIGYNFD